MGPRAGASLRSGPSHPEPAWALFAGEFTTPDRRILGSTASTRGRSPRRDLLGEPSAEWHRLTGRGDSMVRSLFINNGAGRGEPEVHREVGRDLSTSRNGLLLGECCPRHPGKPPNCVQAARFDQESSKKPWRPDLIHAVMNHANRGEQASSRGWRGVGHDDTTRIRRGSIG